MVIKFTHLIHGIFSNDYTVGSFSVQFSKQGNRKERMKFHSISKAKKKIVKGTTFKSN